MENQFSTLNIESFFLEIYELVQHLARPEMQAKFIYYLKITQVSIFILTILLSLLLAWMMMQIKKLRDEEREIWAIKCAEPKPISDETRLRWEKINKKMESDNQSDWKIAVIEADNLLEEILIDQKVPGENLGEKLKAMPKESLASLDDAWEAHKFRNRIAHDGQIVVDKKEAADTLLRFERVFKELEVL